MKKHLPTKREESGIIVQKSDALMHLANKLLKHKSNLPTEAMEHLQLYLGLGHSDDVTSITLSNDGRYLFSGSKDKTIKQWEISTGKEVATYVGLKDGGYIAYRPDGYYVCDRLGKELVYFIDYSGSEPRVMEPNHPVYAQRRLKSLFEEER